ncbi:unnamed protein product [Trypanosoma congolense IL3000]|uniref:WGS project CAEQ00000000 data, annotated contig 1129 n=1 Tax=Trypanosoma congolense (strain IL3000) TaxID=1068625 RepID=F9W3Z8_TRYCI|nr:unnamed protein product [Trypanosoma congolense IL3000]
MMEEQDSQGLRENADDLFLFTESSCRNREQLLAQARKPRHGIFATAEDTHKKQREDDFFLGQETSTEIENLDFPTPEDLSAEASLHLPVVELLGGLSAQGAGNASPNLNDHTEIAWPMPSHLFTTQLTATGELQRHNSLQAFYQAHHAGRPTLHFL